MDEIQVVIAYSVPHQRTVLAESGALELEIQALSGDRVVAWRSPDPGNQSAADASLNRSARHSTGTAEGDTAEPEAVGVKSCSSTTR